MGKLLSANYHAMVRSKRFWVGAVLMAGVQVFAVADVWRMLAAGWDVTMDGSAVDFAILLYLLVPALGGLFINTDYHDGTIRNKLTVGCGRAAVFLSNLITLFAAAIFYMVVSLAATLLAGLVLGIMVTNPAELAGKLLLLLPVFLALAAITTFLATLITSRTALIVVVLMAFGLVFFGQLIDGMLQNPEMVEEYGGVTYITNEDGSMQMKILDRDGNEIAPEDIPVVPNPSYVPEPWRTVLRTYNTIQPAGQMSQIIAGGYHQYDPAVQDLVEMHTPSWLLVLYSLAVTLAFTGAGILLFRRKDLK